MIKEKDHVQTKTHKKGLKILEVLDQKSRITYKLETRVSTISSTTQTSVTWKKNIN